MFKKLGQLIQKIPGAGLIGNVIEMTPAGAAGKIALGLVKGALGIQSDDPAVLEKALANDPEAAARILQAQMDNEVDLKTLQLEFAKLDVERERLGLEEHKVHQVDRAGAREREMEITKVTGHRDLNMLVLSWVVVGGFFGLLGILIFQPLAPGSEGYINQLFGALTAGFGAVLNYFFGSSKSDVESRDAAFQMSASVSNGHEPDSSKPWETDEPVDHMSVKELRECLRSDECPQALKERARKRLQKLMPAQDDEEAVATEG